MVSCNPLKLEPPFLVTWTAMAVDLGLGEKEQRISAEMANKLVVLPPIVHILFARQNNMTREETAGTQNYRTWSNTSCVIMFTTLA